MNDRSPETNWVSGKLTPKIGGKREAGVRDQPLKGNNGAKRKLIYL